MKQKEDLTGQKWDQETELNFFTFQSIPKSEFSCSWVAVQACYSKSEKLSSWYPRSVQAG